MPAPVNPNTRPLPSGWEERFDARKGAWFYVQRNTIPSRATYIHPSDLRFSTSTSLQSTSTSSGPDHSDPDCPVPALGLRDRGADNTPAMITSSFAQRLYASALPSKNSPDQTGDTSVVASNSADGAPGGPHISPHSTGPNETRTNRGSYSPPLLSLASLSLNSAENNSSTSLDTGGSFYRGPVAGQTPTRLNGDLRLKETHVHPHRTQTQPVPSSTNTSVVDPHRASTISITANPSMYTKPYTFTPPSEIPNRILVARPPSHASQSSTSLSGSWPTGTGTSNQSPPPPPAKPGYSSYNSSPAAGNYSSLASSPNPSQYPTNVTQTLSLPTSYNQTQYNNCPSPSSLTNSVQTPLTPPFTPPMASSIPAPSMNGNALLAAAGKSVLRFALGSVFGVVTPDILFSGLASSVLDTGMLDALTGSLSNLDVNSAGLDLAQFQAAFQGAPGTDYQGIINSIIQQQQVSPSSGVDYQVILNALTKIHSAQAHGGGLGGSSLGLGGLVGYQPMVNAQNQQQIQALTSAIQQQAAQNAQMIQQQIQQIQNSSQPNTTHVQSYLQAAYQQQLAMSAGASNHQQQPQTSASMMATQQPQTLALGHQQQHSAHTSNQSVSQTSPQSQNTQNPHFISTQQSLPPLRPPHSTGSSQTSPAISGPSNQQPSHTTVAQPPHSSASVPPRPPSFHAPATQQPPRPQSYQLQPVRPPQQQPPRPPSQHVQSHQHSQPPRPPLQQHSSHSGLQYQQQQPPRPPQHQPPRPPPQQQPPRPTSQYPPTQQQQQQGSQPQYQQPQQQASQLQYQQQQQQQVQYQPPSQQQQQQQAHYQQQQQQQPQYQQQQSPQPQYQEQQPQPQYQQEQAQTQSSQEQLAYYNPQNYQQEQAYSPYPDSSSGYSPEQTPGYTVESESGGNEGSSGSFTSMLGSAFDLGTQLLHHYAANNNSAASGDGGGEAAPGYTLTDEGGNGEGGGGTSFFDGVLSYGASLDFGSASFDIGGSFATAISVGDDSAPEYS
ncbi:hypothetical protein PQX77_020895 [Marasmius sp. AFHP31]|nr:hypothetical protein PQX77_020895 [Marasmius sp. AFHP31]